MIDRQLPRLHWRSVSVRPTEEDGCLFLVVRENVHQTQVCRYLQGYWCDLTDECSIVRGVTHWAGLIMTEKTS